MGLTRLESRRIRSDLIETYKIINNAVTIHTAGRVYNTSLLIMFTVFQLPRETFLSVTILVGEGMNI